MQITQTDNIHFKAIPISKIKVSLNGKLSNYTAYKVSPLDYQFMEDIYVHTNVKKRMPGLNQQEYQLWDGILDFGLRQILHSKKTTILLANNDKAPCGFLNYSTFDTRYIVNYVSTWPIIPKVKELLAGKVLFNELFHEFSKSDKKDIELEALRYAPFSPINKYRELGFGSCGGSNFQETMRINKTNIIKSIEKLKETISRNPIKEKEELNLYEELSIVKD